MSRPNSFGSKSNRERRRAVAQENAKAEQINCKNCASKHRALRPCAG